MLNKTNMKEFWENQAMKVYVTGTLSNLQCLCEIYLNTPTGREFGLELIWNAIARARKLNLEELLS